jgi:hypothetical protein
MAYDGIELGGWVVMVLSSSYKIEEAHACGLSIKLSSAFPNWLTKL